MSIIHEMLYAVLYTSGAPHMLYNSMFYELTEYNLSVFAVP